MFRPSPGTPIFTSSSSSYALITPAFNTSKAQTIKKLTALYSQYLPSASQLDEATLATLQYWAASKPKEGQGQVYAACLAFLQIDDSIDSKELVLRRTNQFLKLQPLRQLNKKNYQAMIHMLDFAYSYIESSKQYKAKLQALARLKEEKEAEIHAEQKIFQQKFSKYFGRDYSPQEFVMLKEITGHYGERHVNKYPPEMILKQFTLLTAGESKAELKLLSGLQYAALCDNDVLLKALLSNINDENFKLQALQQLMEVRISDHVRSKFAKDYKQDLKSMQKTFEPNVEALQHLSEFEAKVGLSNLMKTSGTIILDEKVLSEYKKIFALEGLTLLQLHEALMSLKVFGNLTALKAVQDIFAEMPVDIQHKFYQAFHDRVYWIINNKSSLGPCDTFYHDISWYFFDMISKPFDPSSSANYYIGYQNMTMELIKLQKNNGTAFKWDSEDISLVLDGFAKLDVVISALEGQIKKIQDSPSSRRCIVC